MDFLLHFLPSMPSFSPEDLIISAVIFLVIYAAIMFAFARRSFLGLLRGLLINLGWVFSSPFKYVLKTIHEIASIGDSREHRDGTNEQYLISRFLVIMRSAVVAIAIGVLATSIMGAWKGFLPSEFLRNAVDQCETQISQVQKSQTSIRDEIGKMDKEWATDKPQMKQKYDEKRSKSAAQSKTLMQDSEVKAIAQGQGGTLTTVKELLERRPHGTISEIVDATRVANDFVQQTATGDTSNLSTYISAWRSFTTDSLPSRLTDDELRAVSQPGYREQTQQLQDLSSREASLRSQETQLQQQEQYHPFLFLLILLFGVIEFMFVVWILGMLLEFLLISIFIARDVRHIRKDMGRQMELPTDKVSA